MTDINNSDTHLQYSWITIDNNNRNFQKKKRKETENEDVGQRDNHLGSFGARVCYWSYQSNFSITLSDYVIDSLEIICIEQDSKLELYFTCHYVIKDRRCL